MHASDPRELTRREAQRQNCEAQGIDAAYVLGHGQRACTNEDGVSASC